MYLEKNLCYLLTCKAVDETRVTTRKMVLVMNLCCLLNYKAFGGPRVKIR